MPATIEWLEEPHIILIEFSGQVDAAEMRHIIAVAVQALAAGPVYFLKDFTATTSFDPKILELSSLSEWLYHPNARWFAYVGVTGLSKQLISLRHQNDTRFFKTRAEAEQFLRSAAQEVLG